MISKPLLNNETHKELSENILLEVHRLKKFFPVKTGILQKTTGYIRAVDDLSFHVKKGETLGIVGESGCGKSTVGRTIIRLYEPTEGQILFKGRDISKLPEKKLRQLMRKDMQMIFQDPYASLNPRITIEKGLKEPLKTHHYFKTEKEYKERVNELLTHVGLDPIYSNRYPHEFSGGQRQRIGIARALALQPDLIIADEAVSALDVSIQAQIINLMEDLQEKFQLTYIFISHDLSVVRHISDRVAVLYLGKLMELSTKEELYNNPLHPYTQALLSAVPVMRKKGVPVRERVVLKGELPSSANPPKGCVFHTRCPMAMEICHQTAPPLKEMHTGHFVACHLYS